MFHTGIEPTSLMVQSKHSDTCAILRPAIRQDSETNILISAKKAPVKTPVEVPADIGTLQSEYDELKKDQDDLLELLSDQQLKIGIGFLPQPQQD